MIKSPLEIINNYIEEEWAHFKEPNLTDHHKKRMERSHLAPEEEIPFEMPKDMTKAKYDEGAHQLTRSQAKPVTSFSETDIQGYITQQGRKVKFKKDPKYPQSYFYACYVGEDESGTIITYFKTKWKYIISTADPRKCPLDPKADYRYKCDLDGKFRGLNAFSGLPSELKEKIMKGELL